MEEFKTKITDQTIPLALQVKLDWFERYNLVLDTWANLLYVEGMKQRKDRIALENEFKVKVHTLFVALRANMNEKEQKKYQDIDCDDILRKKIGRKKLYEFLKELQNFLWKLGVTRVERRTLPPSMAVLEE